MERQTSVAAAYSTGQSTQAPRIVANRDSSRVIHRELVANITGSTAYTIAKQLALNPGMASTFPWLSTQAQSWETYRFNRLDFQYYTRTGSNVPGSVALIPDYDAADPAPVSELAASSFEDVKEDAPWKDLVCRLRPAAMHSMGPKKFIRSQALAVNEDIKTYDCGNLFVSTVDGTAVPWGKLWVDYDVTLFTPALNPLGSGAQASQHIIGATPTTANILGAAPVQQAGSTTIATVAGSVVTFNSAGEYLLLYTAQSTTDTVADLVLGGGGAFVATYGGIGGSAGQNISGSATALLTMSTLITAVIGTTVTFANTVVGGSTSELFISQVPAAQA